MERRYGLIIIGAGSAGMSTAIYGSRAGLKTAMLGMGAPGRKLIRTTEVSNWPGIIEANGAKLASDMFEYSTSFGTGYLHGNVTCVEDGTCRKIVCGDGTEYKARAVIVATETQERMMNMPGELESVGHGAFYYTVCDGVSFRDQEIVVIDGDNSVLEEVNYLTQFVSKANIIIRWDTLHVDNIVRNAIENNPKTTMVTKHVPVRVVDNGMCITGLVIRNVDTSVETGMKAHSVSPYIGLNPVTPFLEGLGILNERGYMTVDENCEIKTEGIYGAGDAIAKKLRQVVTAVNDGAITARHAFHEIKGI